MLDILRALVYYIEVGKRAAHMEQYRSGHNGHDWKSCVPQKGTEGSNPSCSARTKSTGNRKISGAFYLFITRFLECHTWSNEADSRCKKPFP